MNGLRSRWKECLWLGLCLAGMASVGFVEVRYSDYLRKQHQTQSPESWRTLSFNGSTNFLVPWVLGENELYAAKVNQIRLHGFPYDPFIRENRDFSSWIPNAATFYAIALMSLPFERIQTAWITIQYAVLLVWFCLLVLVFRKMADSPRADFPAYLLASLIPFCLSNVFMGLSLDFSCPNPGKWAWLLFNMGHMKLRAIELLRLGSPLVTQFFLLIWLSGIVLYLGRSPRRPVFLTAAIGLLGGGLVLVHYFEWSYGMATLGVLWALSLFRSEWKEYRGSLSILLAAACVTSLVFLKLVTAQVDPSVIARTGLEHARRFDLGSLLLLIVGGWAAWRAPSRGSGPAKIFWALLGSALIAGFAAVNLSLLTGVYLQNFLYYRCAYFFLSLVFSAWLLEKASVSERFNRSAGALVVLLLTVTLFNAKSFAEKHYRICALPLSWEQGLDWLNGRLAKDDKVLSLSPFVTRLLPVYTPAKLQVSDGFPVNSKMTTDANLERMAVMLKTLSVNPERFLAQWSSDPSAIRELGSTGESGIAGVDRCWGIVLGHASSDQETFPSRIAADYPSAKPLDEPFYVWVNRWEKPWFEVPPERQPGLERVYQNEEVEIYASRRGGRLSADPGASVYFDSGK